MNVAGTKLSALQVTELAEHEQRMVAGAGEVAVVGATFLIAERLSNSPPCSQGLAGDIRRLLRFVLGSERDRNYVPSAEALFPHRKIGAANSSMVPAPQPPNRQSGDAADDSVHVAPNVGVEEPAPQQASTTRTF